MNKFKLLSFFIILILILIQSCDFRIVKSLVNESSEHLIDSKNAGYFISSYDTATIKINDSIDFRIIEAFVERPHRLSSYNDTSYLIDSSKIQIILWFDKDLTKIKGYKSTWQFDSIAHVYSNKFIGTFNRISPPDSIMIGLFTIQIDSSGRAGKNDDIEFDYFKIRKK
jgi:hypothetical protein